MMRPEERLLKQITAWLERRGPRFRLRFDDELEDRFELDTGRARGRYYAWVSAMGAVMFLLWDSSELVSGLPLNLRLLHLGIVLPPIAIGSFLFTRNLGKAMRESLVLFINVMNAVGFATVFAPGWWHDTPQFAVSMTTIIVFGGSVLALRTPWALANSLVVLAITAVSLFHSPIVPARTAQNVTGSMAIVVLGLMVANWRHEADERRAYVRALRDRLSRLTLSQRYRELDELSKRDALTGLANRRGHDTWLQEAWSRARQENIPVGLIVVDIDHFKRYNDCYGHAAGDSCLQIIAKTLRDQLRGNTDYAARLGGEEFVCVLPGCDEARTGDIAERLRVAVEALELPHGGIGPGGIVTISAGAASFLPDGERQHEALFSAADAALYVAKVSGRNRVAVGEVARETAEIDELLFWRGAAPEHRYSRTGGAAGG